MDLWVEEVIELRGAGCSGLRDRMRFVGGSRSRC